MGMISVVRVALPDRFRRGLHLHLLRRARRSVRVSKHGNCRSIIDNSVLSLDKAFFLQALAERDDKVLGVLRRKPTTCCALAAIGQVAATPPSSVMNSWRFMPSPS
jgi:hypothetical protein